MDDANSVFDVSWTVCSVVGFFVFLFVWMVQTFDEKEPKTTVESNEDEVSAAKSTFASRETLFIWKTLKHLHQRSF